MHYFYLCVTRFKVVDRINQVCFSKKTTFIINGIFINTNYRKPFNAAMSLGLEVLIRCRALETGKTVLKPCFLKI